jgi:hypothetical protein
VVGKVEKVTLLLLVQVVAVPQLTPRESCVVRRLLGMGPLVGGRYWSRVVPVVCNIHENKYPEPLSSRKPLSGFII